jgi:hypothetical protein
MSKRGCLVDVGVAVALFVVIGVIAGETHHAHGSYSIRLTTVPTFILIALLLVYYFAYRRPARRRRQSS